MSQENVEIVRRAYEHFRVHGVLPPDAYDADFVWDMTMFNWPEQQTYSGIEGATEFLRDWIDAWEDWELDIEEFRDAGEKVVTIARQTGRAKATGLPTEMHFAQVWTLRGGKQTRMEMYSSPAAALEAVGLRE